MRATPRDSPIFEVIRVVKDFIVLSRKREAPPSGVFPVG